jgi:hypothetical protein
LSDKPNLDLIAMVQRARLAHDANATPSQVAAVYWIEVKRGGDGPMPTSRAGQYVIETTVSAVDVLWATIKAATERGELGYKSKVSTASRGGQPDKRTICVLTYDADDSADVARVGHALQMLVGVEIRYERVTP